MTFSATGRRAEARRQWSDLGRPSCVVTSSWPWLRNESARTARAPLNTADGLSQARLEDQRPLDPHTGDQQPVTTLRPPADTLAVAIWWHPVTLESAQSCGLPFIPCIHSQPGFRFQTPRLELYRSAWEREADGTEAVRLAMPCTIECCGIKKQGLLQPALRTEDQLGVEGHSRAVPCLQKGFQVAKANEDHQGNA